MKAVERVRAAYAAIAAADRPEIWIMLRPLADALSDAEHVDRQDPPLPLAGLVAAVKNNIDVAGIATTAGCPSFAVQPAVVDAPVVARLRAAGAVIIGATNLDQFATGLVGTRSPHGAVRDAHRPEYISGGPVPARRWPSLWAWSTSPWAPTPRARVGYLPPCRASSGSSRPSGWSPSTGWCRPAGPTTA